MSTPPISRSPCQVTTPASGPYASTITRPATDNTPHRSAFQLGVSLKKRNPVGMMRSGPSALMNSAWAIEVLVTAVKYSEICSPRHNAAGVLATTLVRVGSGRARTARSDSTSDHQSSDDPMRRHQAITEPGAPGHLMMPDDMPKHMIAATTAARPRSRCDRVGVTSIVGSLTCRRWRASPRALGRRRPD